MTLLKVSQKSSLIEERMPMNLGQGRLKERIPVAIVDIGSNSVRQVIYEGLTRAPAVLFNEKILCGLGEGLVASGKLNEIAVERALRAVRRFRALQEQANVGEVHIIATAAARDASNGPEFIRQVEEITGTSVEVLTGEMEAKYAGLGIRSGFHNPNGIVGDLGGGSLELVGINGEIENGITLPLGGLRLRELSEGDLKSARKIAREHIKKSAMDWPDKGRVFYAVGGTWRSLGKLHIANRRYPLPAVHDYEVSAVELAKFCAKVTSKNFEKIKGLGAVSKNRRELLPFGAVVLQEVIKQFKPETIAMSSLGVREGYLFSRLTEKEQAKDSLLVASRDLSILRARSPDHCLELAQWTAMAFEKLGIIESENEARYRIAACYLADIGWRAHPDYRAQQVVETISNAGFVGINHEGRAYLAISSFHRYQGLGSKASSPLVAELASLDVQKKARLLAAFFRVLYLFSASNPGVIPRIGLQRTSNETAELLIPADLENLSGERPDERIKQLGKESGIEFTTRFVS